MLSFARSLLSSATPEVGNQMVNRFVQNELPKFFRGGKRVRFFIPLAYGTRIPRGAPPMGEAEAAECAQLVRNIAGKSSKRPVPSRLFDCACAYPFIFEIDLRDEALWSPPFSNLKNAVKWLQNLSKHDHCAFFSLFYEITEMSDGGTLNGHISLRGVDYSPEDLDADAEDHVVIIHMDCESG